MDNPSFEAENRSNIKSHLEAILKVQQNQRDRRPTIAQTENNEIILEDIKISEEIPSENKIEFQDISKTVEPVKVETKEIKAENVDDVKEWFMYTKREKVLYVIYSILKILLFLFFLYFFLLSLSFMTMGFTLVSPVTLKFGPTIKFILANPFAALAIGIIATAIMQNATATTSIAVSMVGARIIPDVQSAIPIIMGANIGTCVTNALIALTLAGDPNQFKRAFSGSTVNDMFNLLTTLVLLPLEIITHALFHLSTAFANLLPLDKPETFAKLNFVNLILNPVVDAFILLDSKAIDRVAQGGNETKLALRCCDSDDHFNIVTAISTLAPSNTTLSITNITYIVSNVSVCYSKCKYWCIPMLNSFGDAGTGFFWIFFSLAVLIVCLFGIVKALSLLIVGPIAKGVRIAINASFPGKFVYATEPVLFIVSFLITLVVQSSNIVTATLVPLCGFGIVTLQRVYVLTLGSNIGTTVTGILTAFTLPASSLKKSLQVAFVYTFFNVFGVLFWLPIPFMRFPKRLAKKLGKIVFKYRWFVFFYVSHVYFIIPLIVFCLALIPYWIGLAIFGIPLILVVIAIVIVKILIWKFPQVLPEKFRNFKWLPLFMRSLKPMNRKVEQLGQRVKCCRCLIKQKTVEVDAVGNEIVQEDNIIAETVRRLSVFESLVDEARQFSRRNTLTNSSSSDDDDDDDDDENNIEKRKHTRNNTIAAVTQHNIDETSAL